MNEEKELEVPVETPLKSTPVPQEVPTEKMPE